MTTQLLKNWLLPLFVVSAFGLTSCSDDDDSAPSEPGQIGEIQIDRDRVGVNQPFTLSSKVTKGEGMYDEEWSWRLENGTTKYGQKNGDLFSYTTSESRVGSHKYFCVYLGKAVSSKIYSFEKEFDVEVVPCDIRNSFWGDSEEETLGNINYFYNKNAVLKDHKIISEEEKRAGSIHPDISRTVYYDFSNNQLQSITYDIDMDSHKACYSLAVCMREMATYDGFDDKNAKLDYTVVDGKELTSEEKTLAEGFKNGENLGKLDRNDVLGKAVKEGRLELTATCDKVGGAMTCKVYYDKEKGAAQFIMEFSRK